MSAHDFSKCLYDITVVPNKTTVIEFYSELASYQEFNAINDIEMRIAICISDIESPFIKIKEPRIRLNTIFEFLGINLNELYNQELYSEVLNYSNEKIISACCRLIQQINNHDYSIWWTLNLSFYDLQKESAKPKDDSDTTKNYVSTKIAITTEMNRIGEKLKDLEARLFSDTKLKQRIVDQELRKISLYPERMAQDFQGFHN